MSLDVFSTVCLFIILVTVPIVMTLWIRSVITPTAAKKVIPPVIQYKFIKKIKRVCPEHSKTLIKGELAAIDAPRCYLCPKLMLVINNK